MATPPYMAFLLLAILIAMCVLVSCDDSYCRSMKNGTMVGGRCFFYLRGATIWTESWSLCQKNGGVLAQIHTTAEYDAIMAMFNAAVPPFSTINGAHIALERDAGVLGSPCAVTNDTTYWYDLITQKNLGLNAGNTWLRNEGCKDKDKGGEYYFHLFTDGRFVDAANDDMPYGFPPMALCEIANTTRNYTKTSVCIEETPVETCHSCGDVQSCANKCSTTIWCHSFNFIIDEIGCSDHKCELFSWVSHEVCPKCPAMSHGRSDCLHYDVIQ